MILNSWRYTVTTVTVFGSHLNSELEGDVALCRFRALMTFLLDFRIHAWLQSCWVHFSILEFGNTKMVFRVLFLSNKLLFTDLEVIENWRVFSHMYTLGHLYFSIWSRKVALFDRESETSSFCVDHFSLFPLETRNLQMWRFPMQKFKVNHPACISSCATSR